MLVVVPAKLCHEMVVGKMLLRLEHNQAKCIRFIRAQSQANLYLAVMYIYIYIEYSMLDYLNKGIAQNTISQLLS